MGCPGSRISDPTTEDKLKRTLSYIRQYSSLIVIKSTYRVMSHSLLISYDMVLSHSEVTHLTFISFLNFHLGSFDRYPQKVIVSSVRDHCPSVHAPLFTG
jgi:hypothetical protein